MVVRFSGALSVFPSYSLFHGRIAATCLGEAREERNFDLEITGLDRSALALISIADWYFNSRKPDTSDV
jgi:hypothetical protein